MAHTFECSVCYLTPTQTNAPTIIDNSEVCDECIQEYIVPLFEAALQTETRYPASWGPVELSAADFEYALGEPFVQRYHQREREYAVPMTKRVYCKHQLLAQSVPEVGTVATTSLALTRAQVDLAKLIGKESTECGTILCPSAEKALQCYKCMGLTCSQCQEPVSLHLDHVCSSTRSPPAIPDGLIRGKDIQICPNPSCHYVVALGEACNHMRCPLLNCKTQFCFICGLEAKDGSGHWNLGGCPRYNHPDAQEAQYDDGDHVDDGEEDEDDDDDTEPWLTRPPPTDETRRTEALLRAEVDREISMGAHLIQDLPDAPAKLAELADLLFSARKMMLETRNTGASDIDWKMLQVKHQNICEEIFDLLDIIGQSQSARRSLGTNQLMPQFVKVLRDHRKCSEGFNDELNDQFRAATDFIAGPPRSAEQRAIDEQRPLMWAAQIRANAARITGVSEQSILEAATSLWGNIDIMLTIRDGEGEKSELPALLAAFAASHDEIATRIEDINVGEASEWLPLIYEAYLHYRHHAEAFEEAVEEAMMDGIAARLV